MNKKRTGSQPGWGNTKEADLLATGSLVTSIDNSAEFLNTTLMKKNHKNIYELNSHCNGFVCNVCVCVCITSVCM